jgi:hypothetical protein
LVDVRGEPKSVGPKREEHFQVLGMYTEKRGYAKRHEQALEHAYWGCHCSGCRGAQERANENDDPGHPAHTTQQAKFRKLTGTHVYVEVFTIWL